MKRSMNKSNMFTEDLLFFKENNITHYVNSLLVEIDEVQYIDINKIKDLNYECGGSPFDYIYQYDNSYGSFKTNSFELYNLTPFAKEFYKSKLYIPDSETFSEYIKNRIDEILNNYKGGEVIYDSLKLKNYRYYKDNECLIPFDIVIGIFMLYTNSNMCILFHNSELDSLPDFSDEIVEDIFNELFNEDN